MPRTSPRRLALYLLALLTFLLVAANLHLDLALPNLHHGLITNLQHAVVTSLQPPDQAMEEAGQRRREAPSPVPPLQPKPEAEASQKPQPPVVAAEKPPAPAFPDRPWYMVGGQVWPSQGANRNTPVFPEEAPTDDRVPGQLMYMPPLGVLPADPSSPSSPLKKILLWNGAASWGNLHPGRGEFLKQQCPVNSCVIATNRAEAESADLILFKDHFSAPIFTRRAEQLWMIYLLECPLHTQVWSPTQRNLFNWTATYRSDSTIVAPYERWQLHKEDTPTLPLHRNYAANKTKQVAWFVSNCGARNGRLQYAQELAKYIGVDIYGACGTLRCPRTNKCFSMLDTDYKFYLAFENSNCRDYITEKFFVNGLGHDVLPIVMGARPEDYARSAPHHSYIHVDSFTSPKDLASYLLELDRDDEKYNQYFAWKGTGEFINTRFFCRVCALLHNNQTRDPEHTYYRDINEWWRGEGTCSNSGWRLGKEVEEEEEGRSKEEENEEGKETQGLKKRTLEDLNVINSDTRTA